MRLRTSDYAYPRSWIIECHSYKTASAQSELTCQANTAIGPRTAYGLWIGATICARNLNWCECIFRKLLRVARRNSATSTPVRMCCYRNRRHWFHSITCAQRRRLQSWNHVNRRTRSQCCHHQWKIPNMWWWSDSKKWVESCGYGASVSPKWEARRVLTSLRSEAHMLWESAQSLGEADCESSQRQVLATSPVEVQDEGHGRASVLPSSVDVECSKNELQKTGIQEVNKAMNKRL